MRPSSPLSGFTPAPRFEPGASSPRSIHSRVPSATTGNTTRRADTRSLKLPSLPRFHPANFPSTHQQSNLGPGEGQQAAPMSPRSHSRMYSDAQKQLLMFHRGSVQAAASRSGSLERKPLSPRLAPLASPGLVITPFELELEEGLEYFDKREVARTLAQQSEASRNAGEEGSEEQARGGLER
ncbi:hypothetical protein B0A48_04229 [Cryoendolithus antarcticus]|uniref:Uncharacterized protein n=1 Tax=Cryoendolithus antarcticus TaxID=1507870 RepID=A0A1V8TET6_9PEZI|nr:hypothetical protein B0A48_04229 [Cryoendolithus antarcticus]